MATQQKYTVNPKLLVSLMVLFMIIFGTLFFVLNSEAKIKQAQLDLLKQEKEIYGAELRRLQSEIEYAQSPQGIEQYARAKGMIMPGEVQFVAGEGSNLQ